MQQQKYPYLFSVPNHSRNKFREMKCQKRVSDVSQTIFWSHVQNKWYFANAPFSALYSIYSTTITQKLHSNLTIYFEKYFSRFHCIAFCDYFLTSPHSVWLATEACYLCRNPFMFFLHCFCWNLLIFSLHLSQKLSQFPCFLESLIDFELFFHCFT